MTETAVVSWAAAELGGAKLGDARLNRRLVRVAERLGAQPGASIPVACGGWAETQAAYRLLANEAVDWEGGLAPHWDCSIDRQLTISQGSLPPCGGGLGWGGCDWNCIKRPPWSGGKMGPDRSGGS